MNVINLVMNVFWEYVAATMKTGGDYQVKN